MVEVAQLIDLNPPFNQLNPYQIKDMFSGLMHRFRVWLLHQSKERNHTKRLIHLTP